MHPCNRGETLTRSVQEKAANRTLATKTRAQVCERPDLFIGLGACDNCWVCASNILGSARALACYSRRLAAKHSHRYRNLVRGHSPAVGEGANRSTRGRVRSPEQRLGANANFRLSRPVRLSFGAQHHDCPWTLSLLRVREPFPPIWCSRSMGPDPIERDSIGDVRNGASTLESSRAQTAVLWP